MRPCILRLCRFNDYMVATLEGKPATELSSFLASRLRYPLSLAICCVQALDWRTSAWRLGLGQYLHCEHLHHCGHCIANLAEVAVHQRLSASEGPGIGDQERWLIAALARPYPGSVATIPLLVHTLDEQCLRLGILVTAASQYTLHRQHQTAPPHDSAIQAYCSIPASLLLTT